MTPLHSACGNGFTDVAVYLLQQAAFHMPTDPVSCRVVSLPMPQQLLIVDGL
jgi:hypothetical protein